jgi:beta,beta-carotene 9',10'-dioxygenase
MTGQFAHGFSSLTKEMTADRLPVEGRVPDWLVGSLLRNGPAQFEVGQHKYHHWFDGLAMLHRFSFQQGRIPSGRESPAAAGERETVY